MPHHRLGAIGLGAASLATGTALTAAALSTAHGASPGESQQAVADGNARVSAFDAGAAIAYVAGGVSLAAGLALVLWPVDHGVQVLATPSGGFIGYSRRF